MPEYAAPENLPDDGSGYRRVQGVVHRSVHGGVLLVDVQGEGARLSGSAGLVWIALDVPANREQIRRRLLDAGMDAEVVTGEAVAEGLAFLVQRGLVANAAGHGPSSPQIAPLSSTSQDATGEPTRQPASPQSNSDGGAGEAPTESPEPQMPKGTGETHASSGPQESNTPGDSDELEEPAVAGAAHRLLLAVAAQGLPGAPPVDVDAGESAPRRMNRFTAAALVTEALGGGLSGPLLAAVYHGEVALPASHTEQLRTGHESSLFWCLHLEHRLLQIDRWLAAAGVPFLVVKGSATAHLDLVDPSERTWADLDLLVLPWFMDRAVAVFEGQGLVRDMPEPRRGWDRRFGKSVTLRFPDGMEVDLHRTLADGAFGARIPLEHLHATAEEFHIAGRPFRAMGRPQRVLHAAYHAVVGSTHQKVSNRRDIARYLTSDLVSLPEVVAEAGRWQGESVLAAAVELARRELVFEAPQWFAWADSVTVPQRERDLVARLRHGEEGLAGVRFDVLEELGSWRLQAAYLWALAVPSAEFRAALPDGAMLNRYRRWLPHVVPRRLRPTLARLRPRPPG